MLGLGLRLSQALRGTALLIRRHLIFEGLRVHAVDQHVHLLVVAVGASVILRMRSLLGELRSVPDDHFLVFNLNLSCVGLILAIPDFYLVVVLPQLLSHVRTIEGQT